VCPLGYAMLLLLSRGAYDGYILQHGGEISKGIHE
jgi:hypothetical protein